MTLGSSTSAAAKSTMNNLVLWPGWLSEQSEERGRGAETGDIYLR